MTDRSEPQWRLARVELVDWGTFSGRTVVDVARSGHLITGPSGSGKSSMLDAIATALTPRGKLHFNAAAQESNRSDDRSLVSYVRGAWSRESDADLNRAVSKYLRTGPTWSGIALRFDDGHGESVSLVKLFQIRGRSTDVGDVKDVSFIDRVAVGLDAFEPFISPSIDVRGIKRAWPGAEVSGGSARGYFARIERLLGPSTTALRLLHRTQAAKNLGTLDQLFREYMLEEPGTFALADNAVQQFAELHAAHRLVVEAREQRDALRAMEPAIAQFEQAESLAVAADRLLVSLPAFQNRLRLELTEDDLSLARTDEARTAELLRSASHRREEASAALEQASLAARALGSDRTEVARIRLTEAERSARDIDRAWDTFVSDLASVGIEPPRTAEAFAEFHETARGEVTNAMERASLHEEFDRAATARKALERLRDDVEQLQRQRSNIPAALLAVRAAISAHLGVDPRSVPFVGELLDVSPAHAEWTGAIERVLRPVATTLAVRADLLPAVRSFVDSRHIGVRLVFESVPVTVRPPRPARSERSLLRRVSATATPFRDWASWRIGEEYDYECVDSAGELERADRAVTITGQIRRGARYEKDDRFRIDDRTQWVLGSDTSAKLDALLEALAEAKADWERSEAARDLAERRRDAELQRRTTLQLLLNRTWEDVDREGAAARVARGAAALERLSQGNPDLERALASEEESRQVLRSAEDDERNAGVASTQATSLVQSLIMAANQLRHAARESLDDDQASMELARRFRSVQRSIGRDEVAEVGSRVQTALYEERDAARTTSATAARTFLGHAVRFRAQWPALVADLTEDIADRAGYRARRAEIESRGLPAHEQSFMRLLRDRSRELIGHLLADLRDAPKMIRERIEPVNASLLQSEYDRDRFLQIRVRDNRSQEVQAFLADLRSVVEGAWAEEELAAAEARFAVLEQLMSRLSSSQRPDTDWRKRCLDTREHVTFQAAEFDGAGAEQNVHDSGAGLSGGQRQKLVVFSLAAALRYQLTSEDDEVPRYGTIVLDEAFDKADASYTRNAMDVFMAFGFHMILATPQKLLGTIEPYVGAVTAVTNETRQRSTLANIRWER